MNGSSSVITRLKGLSLNRKYIPPLLITGILLAAHLSFGILESYDKLLVAIAASFVTESVLHRLIVGSWRDMSSAYISGISVGILIRSPFLWAYALTSMISIASKYVLRYKGTHLWNPSNFGVVAMLLLAPQAVAVLSIQWGNNMWAMLVIWLVGFISIYRLKRFHICATYVISFLVFSVFRSLYTGDAYITEISPITGPMYQLFIFFMITDPKTTVKSKTGQYIVIVMIAFVEMFFRIHEAIYAPFYALFIVGPIAMIIEQWWMDREEKNSEDKEVPTRDTAESQ